MPKVDISKMSRFKALILEPEIIGLEEASRGQICDIFLFTGTNNRYFIYVMYDSHEHDQLISTKDLQKAVLPLDTKWAKVLYAPLD